MDYLKCILTITALIGIASGFPNGAPKKSCSNFYPKHGALPQSASQLPFTITTDVTEYSEGLEITVHVTGNRPLEGIMMAAKSIKDGKHVGRFTSLPSGFHSMNCNSKDDTVTQSNTKLKNNPAFKYLAPKNVGDIEFRATILESQRVFYVGVTSQSVLTFASGGINPPVTPPVDKSIYKCKPMNAANMQSRPARSIHKRSPYEYEETEEEEDTTEYDTEEEGYDYDTDEDSQEYGMDYYGENNGGGEMSGVGDMNGDENVIYVECDENGNPIGISTEAPNVAGNPDKQSSSSKKSQTEAISAAVGVAVSLMIAAAIIKAVIMYKASKVKKPQTEAQDTAFENRVYEQQQV